MRHHRGKAGFHLFDFFFLGNVAHQDDGTDLLLHVRRRGRVFGDGGGDGFADAAFGQRHFVRHRGFPDRTIRGFDQHGQVGIKYVGAVLAENVLPFQTKHCDQGAIEADNLPARIRDQQAVGHVIHDCGHAAERGLQLLRGRFNPLFQVFEEIAQLTGHAVKGAGQCADFIVSSGLNQRNIGIASGDLASGLRQIAQRTNHPAHRHPLNDKRNKNQRRQEDNQQLG